MAKPLAVTEKGKIDHLLRPLSQGEYVVFDIETTGGNPDRNGMTEICAILLVDGREKDRFYSLINPKIPIPPIVRRMTGISNQMVKDAPLVEDVMPRFLAFVGDRVMVSHNTVGDMRFLRYFSEKTVGLRMPNYFLCTHLLAEKLMAEAKDKSLKGLSKMLGFNLDRGTHRADADADLTLLLFQELLKRLDQKGIARIDHAIRFQGDFESGLRLGWGIPHERLKRLPDTPGVITLLDHEGRPSFITAANHIGRELRRLQRFSALPRQVMKAVLAAQDLQYEECANPFAASLRETEMVAQLPKVVDPSIWHNRTAQFVFLVEDHGKVFIRSGPLVPGAFSVIGPIRSGKDVKPFVSHVHRALHSEESSGKGIPAASLREEALRAYLQGSLAVYRPRFSHPCWRWLPANRRKTDEFQHIKDKLLRMPVPEELSPVSQVNGVIAVPEAGQEAIYAVIHGRACFVGMSPEPWSVATSATHPLMAEVKRALGPGPKAMQTLSAKEAFLVNRSVWWVLMGAKYQALRFTSLEELLRERL